MTVLPRIVAVLCAAVGALLLFAVGNALASAGGAQPAVAVGYVLAAIVLGFAAFRLWGTQRSAATA